MNRAVMHTTKLVSSKTLRATSKAAALLQEHLTRSPLQEDTLRCAWKGPVLSSTSHQRASLSLQSDKRQIHPGCEKARLWL